MSRPWILELHLNVAGGEPDYPDDWTLDDWARAILYGRASGFVFASLRDPNQPYEDAPTPRLIGGNAEQQHGTAVPAKTAAGASGTPGRAPSPQAPQGAAGTPTPRASRK